MLASGRLNLIRDDGLRTALATYNERIDNCLYNIQQTRAIITNQPVSLDQYATLTPISPGNVNIQSATGYDIAAMARDRAFRRRLDTVIVVQTWIYANMASQRRAINAALDAMGEAP